MKILILGVDGYIGKPLRSILEGKGHKVDGIDNLSRRIRANSLIPESSPQVDYYQTVGWLPNKKYDCVVHLAEQPSAPWSMRKDQSITTQEENVLGTLKLLWEIKEKMPDAHLVKLGSMGEYGTPDCEITEGYIERGRYKGMMFPRQPGSFYHLSKVFDSMNIEFACRTWGLRSTDIMQGVVFGVNYWEKDLTRFDYDEFFGTVINRFIVQSLINHPLTVYGQGGQTRGFLPLKDSLECLALAIENPPESSEYRVFNQYAKILSVNEIARAVKAITGCEIQHIKNPRVEKESHIYNTKNENLRKLGYNPSWNLQDELKKTIDIITKYIDNVDRETINPTTSWCTG